MTLEEKAAMTAGSGIWFTTGIERLGIPRLKVSDGPIGVRGAGGPGSGPTSACFPCGSALAATWAPELIAAVGEALAEEAQSKGVHVVLGPTVNIHRSPLGGRNFECYSEDPFLTARIAVGFIRGIQGRGVGACLKHFVCNDSEFERHTISSEIGERALREIYLYPFEAAVREADPWSIMSSYNRVNGVYASESRELLTGILRDEWGWPGFVVSDWFGTHDGPASVRAGLDLEMPGPARQLGPGLVEAVRKGEVEESVLDQAVRRLLGATARAGAFARPQERPEQSVDRAEHRQLARRVACEGMVLLRNEEGALPLDAAGLRSLALIGPNAHPGAVQGGGSARVQPHYAVSPLEALRERCPAGLELVFERGCTSHKRVPPLEAASLGAEYFQGFDLSGPAAHSEVARSFDLTWLGRPAPGVGPDRFSVRWSGEYRADEAGAHTFALTSAGKSRLYLDGELVIDNWTRQERGESFFGLGTVESRAEVSLEAGPHDLRVEYSSEGTVGLRGIRIGCLPPLPDDLLERAVEAARRCDVAVVVVGLNADWESEGHDRADMELPGRQAELVERVAAANPRTVVVLNAGGPVRAEWAERVPGLLQAWYPGQEWGNALADVLFGDADPGGRLPTTWPARLEDGPSFLNYPGESGKVLYGEGVFVGYRYFDAKRVEPRFAFGHGLSYARFEYGPATTSAAAYGPGDPIEISVEVRNVGARAGREVVQLYLSDVESSLARPPQELRGFQKVTLEPGASAVVRFALETRALAAWDPGRGDWVAEPGAFEARIGRSSRDIRARARFELRA